MSGLVNNSGVVSVPCSQALDPYLRVVYDATNGLAAAGPEDKEIGTLERRHIVSGVGTNAMASVVVSTPPGKVRMVAAGAITQFDIAYGAEGGKIASTPNQNPIGMVLEAATADGDEIEVLRIPALAAGTTRDIPGIVIEDDFIGDYPAAGTGLDGQGPVNWTKTETNGLGVIGVDAPNGILKFSADAVAEAATATLFMENSPVDIDQNPIFICRLAVYDIGDDAAVDIDFGLASDDHATDFESIACFAAFHLDGADLSLNCHSDDGTTDTAAVDSTVDLVDDTYYDFKIDCTDKSAVTFWYKATTANNWTQLCSATTFDIDQYTGALTPIVMVEKTSNDSTFDVRLDYIKVTAERT